MLKTWIFFVWTCGQVAMVTGHGHLVVPPQRSTLWRTVTGAPVNVDDHGLNCGGFSRQFERNGGKCGVCGDAWDLPMPRPHEDGGEFGQGYVAGDYTAGDVINIVVNITANHYGWFELRLCPQDDPSRPLTQDCLDNNLLTLFESDSPHSTGMTRYYLGEGRGTINVTSKLPDDITCEKCVLQWKYKAGNSWGCDKECCIGCGNQEHFYNCADIRIHPPGGTNHNIMRNVLNPNIQQSNSDDHQRIRYYDDEDLESADLNTDSNKKRPNDYDHQHQEEMIKLDSKQQGKLAESKILSSFSRIQWKDLKEN
ncbi:hypothetical protein FSP39_020701 [Pinctada imbricata]|uniref:Chitin-binding type-4 domain-containing protein n=1 Tax=Pinctada imbricata TaxID=66713 RepID=A0AA88Y7R7_PINIB|nr:hypothetical protein FSP39_020701 [Pinctada imbricata]